MISVIKGFDSSKAVYSLVAVAKVYISKLFIIFNRLDLYTINLL